MQKKYGGTGDRSPYLSHANTYICNKECNRIESESSISNIINIHTVTPSSHTERNLNKKRLTESSRDGIPFKYNITY